jgi:hypothetical protein
MSATSTATAPKEAKTTVAPAELSPQEQHAAIIRAGRSTAVCGCGDVLVRPKMPENSTWRCMKHWNGTALPTCQRGIPTNMVLDAAQVAECERKKKDKEIYAQDIG